jgi:hypothetical protein
MKVDNLKTRSMMCSEDIFNTGHSTMRSRVDRDNDDTHKARNRGSPYPPWAFSLSTPLFLSSTEIEAASQKGHRKHKATKREATRRTIKKGREMEPRIVPWEQCYDDLRID